MPVNGVALAAIGAGVIFVWSGVKGGSVLSTVQNIVSGKKPTGTETSTLVAPGGNSSLGSLTTAASGSLAGIAQSYIGKLRYVYGGPPPTGTVDCSSFVSKCLNQAGVANPGGAPFNPNSHGPTTLSYIAWSGATTVGHVSNVAQAGDLIVWQTHMGIAVGNGQYVSAHDPAQGVGQSPISFPGEYLFVRRLK